MAGQKHTIPPTSSKGPTERHRENRYRVRTQSWLGKRALWTSNRRRWKLVGRRWWAFARSTDPKRREPRWDGNPTQDSRPIPAEVPIGHNHWACAVARALSLYPSPTDPRRRTPLAQEYGSAAGGCGFHPSEAHR